MTAAPSTTLTTSPTPTSSTTVTSPSGSALTWLRQRWPTLAGIAMAAFTALDLSGGSQLAPILAASGLVYLGAAALGRPATAWLVFAGTFVAIGGAKVAGGTIDGTWVLLAAGALFASYGLLRGATHPRGGVPLQALAMAGFGGAAAVTLLLNETAGGYLVAAGLLGHAAWDVYHHRINKVVVRSMAEFCVVLDTLLAVAMLIAVTR